MVEPLLHSRAIDQSSEPSYWDAVHLGLTPDQRRSWLQEQRGRLAEMLEQRTVNARHRMQRQAEIENDPIGFDDICRRERHAEPARTTARDELDTVVAKLDDVMTTAEHRLSAMEERITQMENAVAQIVPDELIMQAVGTAYGKLRHDLRDELKATAEVLRGEIKSQVQHAVFRLVPTMGEG